MDIAKLELLTGLILGACLFPVQPAEGTACGNLPDIRFARPQTRQPREREYKPRALVPFVCQSGFKFDPDFHNTIVCQANGSWSQPPNCIPVHCAWQGGREGEGGLFMVRPAVQEPSTGKVVLRNEFISPSKDVLFMFNSVATLTCHIGYTLSDNGPPSMRCDRAGRWKSPKPQCKRTVCKVPPYPANSIALSAQSPGTLILYEEIVRSRCLRGFMASGVPEAVQEQTCTDNGRWTTIEPCVRVSCGRPPSVENAHVANPGEDFRFGEYTTYTCTTGYRFPPPALSLEKKTFCNAAGHWTAIVQCVAAQCPVLNPLANGDIQIDAHILAVGTEVRYSCRAGFVIVGPDTRRCGQAGNWIGSPPTCHACPGLRLAADDSRQYHQPPARPFLWHAALWNKSPLQGQSNIICTGAFISRRIVVLAAHCFEGVSQHALRSGQVVVRYGTMTPAHERLVWQVYEHPNYDPSTMANNIAILALQKKARADHHMQVMSILDLDDVTRRCLDVAETNRVLSTLYQSSTISQNNIQHQTRTLDMVSATLCATPQDSLSEQLCVRAIDNGEVGSADMASGVIAVHSPHHDGSDGRWILTGLANKPIGTPSPELASFTKISPYIAWMSDVISCEQRASREMLNSRCACQS